MPGPVRDKRFVKKAFNLLDDKKVEDIRAYDLKEVTPFVDYTLIGTCANPAQLKAAAGAITDAAPEAQEEGEAASGWVIVDAGRVVVHVMSAQRREFYRLDQLWESHRISL